MTTTLDAFIDVMVYRAWAVLKTSCKARPGFKRFLNRYFADELTELSLAALEPKFKSFLAMRPHRWTVEGLKSLEEELFCDDSDDEAVYLLIGGQVVYGGSSVNMPQRIAKHRDLVDLAINGTLPEEGWGMGKYRQLAECGQQPIAIQIASVTDLKLQSEEDTDIFLFLLESVLISILDLFPYPGNGFQAAQWRLCDSMRHPMLNEFAVPWTGVNGSLPCCQPHRRGRSSD